MVMPASQNLTKRAIPLIMLAATAAVSPMVLLGTPLGHDLDYQMPGWMETADQLRQGILFQQWFAATNHNFGGPYFIFYPPLSRLIAGVLGLFLPWRMVTGVYVWLALMVAGFAMWKCARELLQPRDALWAALLYATNPYLIINAYKRFALAELLASALFPAVVWGAIRMGRDARHTVLPLSLVCAAMWLSDLPVAVVATYSLAGLIVLVSLTYRSFRPLLYGGIAILAGLGASAFFLLPAAWERSWINIGRVMQFQWRPEHNFLFDHSNLYGLIFNRKVSWIALFLIIVTAAAAGLARQMRRDKPRDWRLLVALASASTFMMLPPSMILYRVLPELKFVQFPWRWLSPLCVACAMLTASAMAETRRIWLPRAIAVFAVAAIALVILYSSEWDHEHHLVVLDAVVHSQEGFRSIVSWCHPVGSDPDKLDVSAPLVAVATPGDGKGLSGTPTQIHIEKWRADRRIISVDSPTPVQLKFRLVNYPGWNARLNGNAIPLQTEEGTGQILITVPPGLSKVEVKFGRTSDRALGIFISLATLLTVFPLMLWLRQPRPGPIQD
jgi:hypothetical protein